MYKEGQSLIGKIKFLDGTIPTKPRPYLIISINNNTQTMKLLVVSSAAGKQEKCGFRSNYLLKNFNPPFYVASFVKLDSLIAINYSQASIMKLASNGECLNNSELNYILLEYQKYNI